MIVPTVVEQQVQDYTFELTPVELEKILFLLKENDETELAQKWIAAAHTQQTTLPETPMSYSQFSLESVRKHLKINIKSKPLFEEATLFEPTQKFKDILADNSFIPAKSEKSRSETIIAPLLIELGRLEGEHFNVLSGERMGVDPSRGLVGECDFIMTTYSSDQVLAFPVFAIVEAKKNDIDLGLGQCAAQLVGAQELNRSDGKDISKIYGCVATGQLWKFLCLEEDELIIDKNDYYLPELDKILGIFLHIIETIKTTS